MKKINSIFRILLIVVAAVAILHTGIAYFNLFRAQNTFSAPAELAFLILVPYALGMIVLLLVWLIIWRVKKMQNQC